MTAVIITTSDIKKASNEKELYENLQIDRCPVKFENKEACDAFCKKFCVLWGGIYPPKEYSEFGYRLVKCAKKQHVCDECKNAIEKGGQYYYASSFWAGGIGNEKLSQFKTCLSCANKQMKEYKQDYERGLENYWNIEYKHYICFEDGQFYGMQGLKEL